MNKLNFYEKYLGQKFAVGSFVKIAKDLGPSMSHFESNKYALVVEYDDGGYCLMVQDNNTWRWLAWYEENQLTLVKDSKKIKELQKHFLYFKNRRLKK